ADEGFKFSAGREFGESVTAADAAATARHPKRLDHRTLDKDPSFVLQDVAGDFHATDLQRPIVRTADRLKNFGPGVRFWDLLAPPSLTRLPGDLPSLFVCERIGSGDATLGSAESGECPCRRLDIDGTTVLFLNLIGDLVLGHWTLECSTSW